MKHDPANPRVKVSYDAMKADIQRQWDYAKDKLGIKFEPWTQDGQPYQNSYEMMKDVRDNKHIYFFQGGDMPADHPLGEVNPQNGLTYNDMLRVVHDLFGHAMEGYQFGGQGEENAWLAHSQMFSPDALPALTTETRGQNSWVNYGPHMRDAEGNVIQQHQQGFIPANQRPYADQKAGLLPDRFHYRTDSPISFMSPNLFNLDMDSAAIRLGSPTHKTFTRISDDLSQALGLNSRISSAIGHWEGGAENSVVQKFPMGTDPDTVVYHGSILARATRQNYFGMFNEEEGGPARLYAFWVDGSKGDAKQIASILDKKRISGSTIEPAEDGHTVFLVSDSEHIKPKIDALKKELGVANVEEYAGRREFIGNKDRDRAERDYTSKIEEIESRHPEWRRIREGIESRADYGHLHGLSRLAENELGEGVPQSYLDQEDTLFRQKFPKSWDDVSKHLSENERARYDTKEKRDKITAAVNSMPSPEEWDAAVKAGATGRLWYERSSRAFDALIETQPDLFKPTDKNKFLNFVAALSPVQPVRQNLLMAVNLWDKWVKAGRPVDVIWKKPAKFEGITSKNASLYRLLKGRGNSYGVDLPARLNNAIRALQDQPMSGPKVSAFAPNLGEDAQRSTNDTWMAILGNTDPNQISQPHLYDAMTSVIRETGEANGIPPRQAQAAAWSFIKSLAELSGWGKDRWIPPQEIIKQGLLTPELINKHAADFADLLAIDPEIRERVKAIGGNLDALDRKLGEYVPTRPEQGSTEVVSDRLLGAAGRLETARSNARIQAHLAAKSDAPTLFDTSFSSDDDVAFNRNVSLDDLKREALERDPRPQSKQEDAFLRSKKEVIKKDGWFTANGKFIPNSRPGQHLETAIKHGLGPSDGNTYKGAWAGGHIRISQFGPNKWGIQSGTNSALTRENIISAIERLPDNAFSIVVKSNYANDDAPKIWNSFSGPSAKVEAQDWVDSGMKKDYAGRDFAMKRENRPDSGKGTEENVGAALTSVSILLAEARRRNPSNKENQMVTIP